MTVGGRESADPLTIRVVLGSLAIVAILLVAIVILRAKLDHLERGLYAEAT